MTNCNFNHKDLTLISPMISPQSIRTIDIKLCHLGLHHKVSSMFVHLLELECNSLFLKLHRCSLIDLVHLVQLQCTPQGLQNAWKLDWRMQYIVSQFMNMVDLARLFQYNHWLYRIEPGFLNMIVVVVVALNRILVAQNMIGLHNCCCCTHCQCIHTVSFALKLGQDWNRSHSWKN